MTQRGRSVETTTISSSVTASATEATRELEIIDRFLLVEYPSVNLMLVNLMNGRPQNQFNGGSLGTSLEQLVTSSKSVVL